MRPLKEIHAAADRAWAREQLSERERADRAVLMQKPSPGDQRLFTPTRCKVLRSFCVNGRPVEIGSVIMLPKFDAESLKALNKVEII